MTEFKLSGYAAIKSKPQRKLAHENAVYKGTFQDFMASLNARTVDIYTRFLMTKMTHKFALIKLLSVEELDILMAHPLWSQMESLMSERSDIRVEALNTAKNYLRITHEKLMISRGRPFSLYILIAIGNRQ